MVSFSYQAHVLDAPGDHAALARDVLNSEGSIVKYWAGFPDNATATRFYLIQPRETRNWYEILRTTRPMCVGLDIDFKLGDPKHAPVMDRLQLRITDSPDAFLAAVLARIFAALPALGGSPRWVSSSHRAGHKVSFHIKFPAYTLHDMTARTLFRAVLSKGALAELVPCVDPSVYDANKAMRLLYSCKLDDPTRVLMPTEAGAAFDAETILRHMWSEVPPDAVPLPSSALLALLPDGWEARNNKRKACDDEKPHADPQPVNPGGDESRHVELVAGAIGDLSAWSTPDARTWRASSKGGATSVLYWKADWNVIAEYRCFHGLTHKSNNFITFEGDDGLIMSRCLSTRCDTLGATRALGAARLVEGPPVIRRAGDVAWREFPGATDAWRQPWMPEVQTAHPAPSDDEEALMSRFGVRVHRYGGESGPAASSLHQWEFYSHSTCPMNECGKVHPAPYRVKVSAASSFARPVLYAQCANETGSRGLALYLPRRPRASIKSIWMAHPTDCPEFDLRVIAVFHAPDWAARVRETLELLTWSAGDGDFYTKMRKTKTGVAYTYADVAERVAYDGEGGFRMSCRSVNPGYDGFDLRPKKHATQRLTADAAAAVGGGYAFGPE